MEITLYPFPEEKPNVLVVIKTQEPLTEEAKRQKANTIAHAFYMCYSDFRPYPSFMELKKKLEFLDLSLAKEFYMVQQ